MSIIRIFSLFWAVFFSSWAVHVKAQEESPGFLYLAVKEYLLPIPSVYGVREVIVRDGYYYVSLVSGLTGMKTGLCEYCDIPGGSAILTNDPGEFTGMDSHSLLIEEKRGDLTYRVYSVAKWEQDPAWGAFVAIYEIRGEGVVVIETEEVLGAMWKEFVRLESFSE